MTLDRLEDKGLEVRAQVQAVHPALQTRAAPGQIRRLVWRDGLSIVAIGVAGGAAEGWAVARALAAFPLRRNGSRSSKWAAVLGTVGLTSLAATWRPAQQAMRVDPVKLLREE